MNCSALIKHDYTGLRKITSAFLAIAFNQRHWCALINQMHAILCFHRLNTYSLSKLKTLRGRRFNYAVYARRTLQIITDHLGTC